jgi:antirestriction protein ArdC
MPNTNDSPLPSSSTAARVTSQIAELLACGVRPWTRPWSDGPAKLPRRHNGEHYKGINVVALWAAASERSYTSPYWMTFNQAQLVGGNVAKGERGVFIVYYAPSRPGRDDFSTSDADANRETRPALLRGYTVFNAEQVTNLPPDTFPSPLSETDTLTPPFQHYAALFDLVPAKRTLANAAYYKPATDTVHMPPLSAFIDQGQYFATLAHELGHWTRHPTRLNRGFEAKRFGDAGYALEELTAELTAAFIGAHLGLPVDHLEDHASYIAVWAKVIRDDPRAFMKAAAHAQTATDYLLRFMAPTVGDPDLDAVGTTSKNEAEKR